MTLASCLVWVGGADTTLAAQGLQRWHSRMRCVTALGSATWIVGAVGGGGGGVAAAVGAAAAAEAAAADAVVVVDVVVVAGDGDAVAAAAAAVAVAGDVKWGASAPYSVSAAIALGLHSVRCLPDIPRQSLSTRP